MPELVLPVGVLRADGDAPPRVDLRCARTERRRRRDWFDRLSGLGLPWLALPERVNDSPSGLALDYPQSLRASVSVSARAAEWGREVAVALPLVIGLARFTLTAADELARHRVDGAPVCPALVRCLPADPVPWRLIALPTGTAVLADWAKSAPEAWGWASPSGLLKGQPTDPVYTLGAALHHGLVGVMFPESLQDRERFARLLRGRVGVPARLEAAARAAVPSRCRSDAEALRQLAVECLDPRPTRRPAAADARTRFAEIESRLTVDRLVRYWEADNRRDIAAKLVRQATAPPEPSPPPGTANDGKDWSEKARDLLRGGNVTAALSAAWNAVFAEGPQKCDLYLAVVQLAAALSPARGEIVSALSRLDQAYTPELIGKASLLRIAHIRMRYLGAAEADIAPLLHPTLPRGPLGPGRAADEDDRVRLSGGDWTRAVGLLLRAVYQVRKNTGYAEASRLCQEGGTVFARMPQGGGEAGKYARAYLALLDGIAHIGFVAAGGHTDYYSDALTRFGTALQLAGEIGARDLLRAAAQWLSWLGWLAGLTPGPAATIIRKAADAMLQLYGGTGPGLGVQEMPEVPWYDEAYIFPV